MLLYSVIILAVAVFFCAATVFFCLRYLRRAFDALDGVLDRLLTREAGLPAEITKENRISKLVHKANRVLDAYVTEAAQVSTEKETIQGFISDLSHQMKTPLSGITMNAELLLGNDADDLTAEERSEFLRGIAADAAGLQWLMEGLIKMSRLEVNAIQLVPVCAPLKPTITDAIGSILAAASAKNISISVDAFDDLYVKHDKRWMQEAIVNILENAVKYSAAHSRQSHAGGKITLSVTTLPSYTKLTITDNGAGIPRGEWAKIFKRFYRGDNAADVAGAGLGLYLATVILEKQNGYIMVDSVVGEFTAFSLFLQNC
ncbi:MAG: HAMP domain-containing histidine kinase [Defluviitaleaceae bacterium]|nr:HAMP domain-containing histidine kinase [Defluviitaleaceae bacterium]MCL2274393.1 HAMP domain-containing histidine kinase [Defluviitaleaceae bacterium]